MVRDRVEGLKGNYADLCELASQRQGKLDESRRMHQFFASIAEEISWLKEKEQLLTSDDVGHDLTSVRSLVSKQKVNSMFLVFKRLCFVMVEGGRCLVLISCVSVSL